MSKPLRLAMPHTAGFVNALREAFGASQIDQAIRAGIEGQPTFWACENGREIGSRPAQDSAKTVSLADIVLGPMAQPKKERK